MTPLTEDETYRAIMQLPGPCPKCKKEMWGCICEHCGHRVSDGHAKKVSSKSYNPTVRSRAKPVGKSESRKAIL